MGSSNSLDSESSLKVVQEAITILGVETKILDYLGDSTFDYGNKLIHLCGYYVGHLSGEFKLQVHQYYRWISSDELDNIDWDPADVELAEKLKQKLSNQ